MDPATVLHKIEELKKEAMDYVSETRAHEKGTIVADPDNSTCLYPCRMINGCECNRSIVHVDNIGQKWGTCTACDGDFGDWDCNSVVMACLNGGQLIHDDVKNRSKCNCTRNWEGPSCQELRCIHSYGGEGEDRVVPKNANHFCDSCEWDWHGIACDQCTLDEQCGKDHRCNTSLIGVGVEKNIQCQITDPLWLILLGNGRPIAGVGKMECTKPSGWKEANIPDGQCFVSIWRVEPNFEWFDPFFLCSLQGCHQDIIREIIPATYKPLPDAAANVRLALQWVMWVCCGVLALGGVQHPLLGVAVRKVLRKICCAFCVAQLSELDDVERSPRVASPGTFVERQHGLARVVMTLLRKSTILYIAAGLQFITLIAFMLFCVFFGHEVDTPERYEDRVQYYCKSSNCTCGPNPPKSYMEPYCKGSTMGDYFMPKLKGESTFSCDYRSGECLFSHKDMGGIPIPLHCAASECASITNNTLPPVHDKTQAIADTAVIAIAALFAGTTLLLVVHYIMSWRQAKVRAIDFRLKLARVQTGSDLTGSSVCGTETSPLLSEEAKEKRVTRESIHEDRDQLCVLRGTNIGYQIIAPGTDMVKVVLEHVSFEACSGQTIAVMGPSGAGKTTLLDILAQREKSGTIEGVLSINGVGIDNSTQYAYKRMCGYVPQQDHLIPALTVADTIRFAARLKLPAPVPDSAIDALVEKLLDLLYLRDCANTRVGDEYSRGISGGEKRRVSIATELVANPRILFLDEPTSGLDSFSAYQVMQAVSNLTRAPILSGYGGFFAYRPLVIFSIHQPSTDIYATFDKVMLLSKGKMVFYGDAERAVSHMKGVLQRRNFDFQPLPSPPPRRGRKGCTATPAADRGS